MPIVINEFEVQVEPPSQPPARGGGAAEQPQPPPQKVRPDEVTSVMRVNRERVERVRAD